MPKSPSIVRLLFLSSLFTLSASTIFVPPALAQPMLPANDGTGTVVNPIGNQFQITGGTQAGTNLFHSFEQFGLSQGQIANFLSQPTITNIFSRVTGGQPSIVNGLLQVTGGNSNLFLINPAGIVFGQNARLDLPAAFTAITADGVEFGNQSWLKSVGANDYKNLTGNPTGFAWTSANPGSIVNAGELNLKSNQAITLAGGSVINTGKISTPGGKVTIAAVPGEKLVRVQQEGHLLSLDLPVAAQAALASESQKPIPPQLPELLTGGQDIGATGIEVENGVAKLTRTNTPIATQPGDAVISGEISVANVQAAQAVPAKIDITGDRIELVEANINASGVNQAGQVRIGGDYQGKGDLPRARQVQVDQGSQIQANAQVQGDGGKIIVWSDGSTQFAGEATAKGGSQAGNGGLVETSGKQTLDVRGARVDASAPQGENGEWLLDPTDINIANAGTITPGTITAALDTGTDVTVSTAGAGMGAGDITLTDSINQTGGGAASLTLTGRRFLRPSTATINLNSTGDLTFNVNQVATESTAPASSIQNAVDAIGAVTGESVINLAPSTYSVTTPIIVNKTVRIDGSDPNTTIITGNNTSQIMRVGNNGNLSLENVTLRNGNAPLTGGAIHSRGNLTVRNSLFLNNRAGVEGGAIQADLVAGNTTIDGSYFANNRSQSGGAIFNHAANPTSIMTITNTIVTNNNATDSGGGIANDPNVRTIFSNGAIFANTASLGGGIFVDNGATLSVSNSGINNNTATAYGGGIYSRPNSTLNLTDIGITGNNAGDSGGGIFADRSIGNILRVGIIDNSATLDAGGLYQNFGTFTITNSNFTRNLSNRDGGAIDIFGNGAQLTLTNVDFIENQGGAGGAIFADPGTTTTILTTIPNSSTFRGNRARAGGRVSYEGGAIYNQGSIDITGATFDTNRAVQSGGAIYNTTDSTLTVSNTTFQNNQAENFGGAIASFQANVNILSSRFINNRVPGGSGGAIHHHSRSLTIANADFENNQASSGGAFDIRSTQLTIDNSDISTNQAISGYGGGFEIVSSNIQITGSRILDNQSAVDGGGFCIDSSTLNIQNTTLTRNTSNAFGGGIASTDSSINLTNVDLIDNQARDGAGISHRQFGAGTTGQTTIIGGTIADNIAGDRGGGIYNNVNQLTLSNVTLRDNEAVNGGGVFHQTGALIDTNSTFDNNQASVYGGAIGGDPAQSITLNGSRFLNNFAQVGGGAIFAPTTTALTAISGFFQDNSTNGSGGGILSTGNVTINNTDFISNASGSRGGGVFITDFFGFGNSTIQASDFLNNTSVGNGGGIFAEGNLQIQDSNISNNISGNNGGGIYTARQNAVISDSLIINNQATNYGGGIELASKPSVQVQNTLIQNNFTLAAAGGGIHLSGATNLTLDQSTLRQNQSGGNGGGLAAQSQRSFNGNVVINNSIFEQNRSRSNNGGGIDINPISLGNLTINQSTFNGNQSGTDGGGISLGPNVLTNLTNVTLTQNQANRHGGAINAYGPLNLTHTTVANNRADANASGNGVGGGIYQFPNFNNTIQLQSTIVANNQAPTAIDVAGQFIDQGNNLIGIQDGSTGFILSPLVGTAASPIDPLLAPLANYGGLTQTMALLPGSRAIDAANSSITTDQRGVARVGLAPDIGAFESRGFIYNMTTGNNQNAIVDTPFASPLQITVQSSFGEPVEGGVITFSSPISGASALLPGNLQQVTIVGNQAAVLPIANSLIGTYNILTDAPGSIPLSFQLTNLPTPPPVPVPPIPMPPVPMPPPPIPTPPAPSPLPPPPTAPPVRPSTPIVPPQQIPSNSTPATLEAESDLAQIANLDNSLSQDYSTQYESALGGRTKINSTALKESLDRLNQHDGKPAVIYAVFVPEVISARNQGQNKQVGVETVPNFLRSGDANSNDRLELILLDTTGRFTRRSTSFTRAQIAEQMSYFWLVNNDVANAKSFETFGHQFYQWLLQPIEPDLQQAKIQTLIYVMDEGLRQIPIATMQRSVNTGPEPNIETNKSNQTWAMADYKMTIAPSLGLLDSNINLIRNQTTVALGVSTFQNLQPLPAVPIELNLIGKQFAIGENFLNQTATYDNLQRQIVDRRPGILHLATHAEFNEGQPEASFIQLWDKPLRIDQLRQLGFEGAGIELLVLSACNTATGSKDAELGFTGLAALSGVRTVLGSLWSISDLGTLAWMSEFYGQLKTTPSRAEAMRQTQQAMRSGQVRIEGNELVTTQGRLTLPPHLKQMGKIDFSHPYYWSGFTIVGSPW